MTDGPQPPAAGAPVAEALPADALAPLAASHGWARAIAIVGFIANGLLAVACAWMAGTATSWQERVSPVLGLFAVMALGGPPTWILWRYAGHVRAVAHGQTERLVDALRAAKHLWVILALAYGASLVVQLTMLALGVAVGPD